MMAKLTLNDLASLTNEITAVANINNNNTAIETAFENTLSRDGTSPNSMNADLDMNSNRILNLPEPLNETEPVRLGDLSLGESGYSIASESEAEAGVSNVKLMTPLRTKDAITSYIIDEDDLSSNLSTKVPTQQSVKSYVDAIAQREKLTSGRTYYINGSSGSNSNTGLTSDAAFKTIQYALDHVSNYLDLNGYDVTIQLADGTYSGYFNIRRMVGGGSIIVSGNELTPSNVVCSAGGNSGVFNSEIYGRLKVQYFQINGGSTFCVRAQQFGYLEVGDGMIFGGSPATHIDMHQKAFVLVSGSYKIVSGAGRHIGVSRLAMCQYVPPSVTLEGSITFTTAFVTVGRGGVLVTNTGTTFTGSASGPKFDMDTGGIIDTGNTDLNFFPGDVAGAIRSGALYNTNTAYELREYSVNVTVDANDMGRVLRHPATDASTRAWTISSNASVPIPPGSSFEIEVEAGAGTVNLGVSSDTLEWAGGGGTGTRSIGSGGWAYVEKVAPTKWKIAGIGIS